MEDWIVWLITVAGAFVVRVVIIVFFMYCGNKIIKCEQWLKSIDLTLRAIYEKQHREIKIDE